MGLTPQGMGKVLPLDPAPQSLGCSQGLMLWGLCWARCAQHFVPTHFLGSQLG